MDMETLTANDYEFFLWSQTATEEEHKLVDIIGENEELFSDMLFDPNSTTGKYIACQSKVEGGEWKDDEVPRPEQLEYFSTSFFHYKVENLPGNICGQFDQKTLTMTISPEYLEENVVVHEMIHMYEFMINDLPLFYHDALIFCLYKKLVGLIPDLDDRIESHGHILNEQSLYSQGGLHDILFLLKSFDLDLAKGYKLGTVFGYGMNKNLGRD